MAPALPARQQLLHALGLGVKLHAWGVSPMARAAPHSHCGSVPLSPLRVPCTAEGTPALVGVQRLSLQGPGALGCSPARGRGAVSASSTSQELLGTGSVSRAPSPKCFASRRARAIALFGTAAAGRHTWLGHTWLGHTWLRAPPGSAREGGGADAEMGTRAGPASLITAQRWAWGQAAAGTRPRQPKQRR